jgi:hypothetical protein
MTSGTTQALRGVWGSSGSDVFAVGDRGTILHYNGVSLSWSPMTSGFSDTLINSVWGSSGSNVFAVDWSGTILHYNGVSWTPMYSGTTKWLWGVWGSSGSNLFAVGLSGTILHLPGGMPQLDGGACASPIPLYCAATLDEYLGSNGLGRTAEFDSYGSVTACPGVRPTTGNEVFYRLDCPVTGEVTVRLTPAEADLDLIIIGEDASDPEGGCDPTQCIAASQTNGLAVEEVTFGSEKGQRFYAVVDGYDGAVSGYTLDVRCHKVP